jgi:hypothetical protein
VHQRSAEKEVILFNTRHSKHLLEFSAQIPVYHSGTYLPRDLEKMFLVVNHQKIWNVY